MWRKLPACVRQFGKLEAYPTFNKRKARAEMADDSQSASIERQIDRLCDRFEAALQSGGEPAIEGYLADVSDAGRQELLRELLRLEVDYFTQADRTALKDDYSRRFPDDENIIVEELQQLDSPSARTSTGAANDVTKLAAAVSPSSLSAGLETVAGQYQMREVIGKGAMGVVYHAWDKNSNRSVALKIIRPELVDDQPLGSAKMAVQRFMAEAKATAGLDHEHIVSVYSVGELRGNPYYAMRYVAGRNLAEVLRDGPLENLAAANYLRPIAEAVFYAHRRGVLHRDIKPHNILIDEENKPLITDFGLAKILGGAQMLTQTGDLLGTPAYMAPEQISDATSVGETTDVYGLGATLYHTLTGHPPFMAATVAETMHQVLHHEPVAPRRLNDAVDTELETICLKCLDKEPHKRYASAGELAEDLQRYADGEPIRARRHGVIERAARWRRRNPSTAVVVAVLIVVGIAASMLVHGLLRQREERLRRAEFRAAAKDHFLALDRELSTQFEFLRLLRAWFEIEQPEREEFQQYALAIKGQHSSIQALEWIPRIRASDRLQHQQQAVASGLADYRIRWRMPDGELVPAGEREEYYPVFFVAPRADNRRVLGYDLSSESSRMAALNDAYATNQTTITEAIQLVQDPLRRLAFLAILPVFRELDDMSTATDTTVASRENLQGFVLGVYRVEDLVNAARRSFQRRDVQLTLVDATGGERQVLYGEAMQDVPEGDVEQFDFELGGRQWSARFTSAAPASQRTYAPQIALLCGICLTMLIAGGLVLSTRK